MFDSTVFAPGFKDMSEEEFNSRLEAEDITQAELDELLYPTINARPYLLVGYYDRGDNRFYLNAQCTNGAYVAEIDSNLYIALRQSYDKSFSIYGGINSTGIDTRNIGVHVWTYVNSTERHKLNGHLVHTHRKVGAQFIVSPGTQVHFIERV
jgi:hypothetical protein